MDVDVPDKYKKCKINSKFWEKVRTTKITTSKTKKNSENSVDDQNVEMVFLVDQNVEIRTSKMSFELIRTPTIRTSKIALKIKN
jgi:hypothetical protein